MQRAIELFDSTLRDGAQGEGISLSVEDKLAITRLLDSLGVAYIEAGNPASNPKDMEYFQQIETMTLAHATIVAFGSTRRKGIKAAQDANVQALLQANAPVCCIFACSAVFQRLDEHLAGGVLRQLRQEFHLTRHAERRHVGAAECLHLLDRQ